MSISNDSLTQREKQPLTRTDVELRLQQAGSSIQLNLAGEEIRDADLNHLQLRGANLTMADLHEAILIEWDERRFDGKEQSSTIRYIGLVAWSSALSFSQEQPEPEEKEHNWNEHIQ